MTEYFILISQHHVLSFSYILWLLENSYPSAKQNAMLFLANALGFKVMVEKFDEKDGLRKLLNIVRFYYILGAFVLST